jgi:hypothetical protein
VRAIAKSGPDYAGSKGIHVGGKRVLRLMRHHVLLAPQRVRGSSPTAAS